MLVYTWKKMVIGPSVAVESVLLQFFQVFILSSLQFRPGFRFNQHKSNQFGCGCGRSANLLQKQSRLLLLGLEFDNIILLLGCSFKLEKIFCIYCGIYGSPLYIMMLWYTGYCGIWGMGISQTIKILHFTGCDDFIYNLSR